MVVSHILTIGQQPSRRRCICKCNLTGYEMEICDPCTTSGSALFRCSSILAYTPSHFFCCVAAPSTWMEHSTCWHSTVRKHSHFQTLFENPSVQAHLTSCAASSASIPENLTALYKSVIIVLWHIHCVSKTYAPWYLIITLANKDWYSKFFHQLIRKKILYMHIKKIST